MKELQLVRRFRQNGRNAAVYCGDALSFLRRKPTGSADILFLDPPFNLGKQYGPRSGDRDRLSEMEYREWMIMVLKNSVRVLSDGGTLYLYHIPIWAQRFSAFLDDLLTFRHWIAISMKNGFYRGKGLYPAHYALLMFTKGEDAKIATPKISPLICRNCNGYAKDYGGYRKIIERNGGVNLSDVWDDLSPVRHRKHKTRAANELPQKLYERVLLISAGSAKTYCEPFGGSGTGAHLACSAGLHVETCDIVRQNCTRIVSKLSKISPRRKLSK